MAGFANGNPGNINSTNTTNIKQTQGRLFEAIKQIDAGVLNVGYAEAGAADGPAVILLHGWPYDIYSFADVTPLLAVAGYRVIIPYLRGYGTTKFLSAETFRNGQQSVLALNIINLMVRIGAGDAKYDDLEKRLAAAPVINVPSITLEGDANGAPHPDSGVYAKKFSGRYVHRVINGGVGHNLPQEAPKAFAEAVVEVDTFSK